MVDIGGEEKERNIKRGIVTYQWMEKDEEKYRGRGAGEHKKAHSLCKDLKTRG
jgi:hypothetical protein